VKAFVGWNEGRALSPYSKNIRSFVSPFYIPSIETPSKSDKIKIIFAPSKKLDKDMFAA
jgi:hypothetical protein